MSAHGSDDQTPPADAGLPPGMTEEQMHELMGQLRVAPAADLLADVFSSLLSTAQVKLGRRDARLFIDLAAQALEYAGPHLPADLTGQVEAALGQLRMAQVTAEGEVAQQPEPEPHDLDQIPGPPRSAPASRPPPAPRRPRSLWVPGRVAVRPGPWVIPPMPAPGEDAPLARRAEAETFLASRTWPPSPRTASSTPRTPAGSRDQHSR